MVTVSAFFDESGKFKDHDVICFGGVVSSAVDFIGPFVEEWARCLDANGLKQISMKDALRANRPLSADVPCLGLKHRIGAILPFLACIRKYVQVITGVAIDAKAFKSIPTHYSKVMGKDPFYTGFLRALFGVLEVTDEQAKISLICDDEEETAEPMYKLYRRVRLVRPDAREKLCAITFADDRWSFGLQAADMIASILRREAGRRFFAKENDYQELFTFIQQPSNGNEAYWLGNIAFVDAEALSRLAQKWSEQAEITSSLTTHNRTIVEL